MTGPQGAGVLIKPLIEVIPETSELFEAILALNPSGYWPLDETSGTIAFDYSGNDHHGVYSGSYALANVAGLDRNHTRFGIGETPGRVIVPDHIDFTGPVGSGLTLYCIVKPDNITSQACVIDKGYNPVQWEYKFWINGPNSLNLMNGFMLSTKWGYTSTTTSEVRTGVNVITTNWQAIATTLDSSNSVHNRLFRNNGDPLTLTVKTGDLVNTMSDTLAPVHIGASNNYSTVFLRGGLAHVAIFKPALTNAQIDTLMNTAIVDGFIPSKYDELVMKTVTGAIWYSPLGSLGEESDTCTEILRDPMENFVNFVPTGTPPNLVSARNGFGFEITSIHGAIFEIPVAYQSSWLTTGCAFRTSNLSIGNCIVFHHNDSIQSRTHLVIGSTGAIFIRRTAGSAILGSSAAGVIVNNTWHYIEYQSKLSDSGTGVGIVRVDGVQVINVTGLTVSGDNILTAVELYSGSSTTVIIDDFYIKTGAGCSFNGDIVASAGALLLNDPCNNLSNWTTNGTVTVVAGGLTGSAFQYGPGSSTRTMYSITADKQTDKVTVGVHFKYGTTLSGSHSLIGLRSDSGATLHLSVTLGSTTVQVSGPGPTLVCDPITNNAGVWHFIEVAARLHDTLGTITVRFDGVQVGASTNIDTKGGGTKTVWDSVYINSFASAPAWIADDIYIRNDGLFGV